MLLGLVTEPHVVLFARAIVGFVLLVAGTMKLGNRHSLVGIVQGYRLLPETLAAVAAPLIPVAELAIGFTLLVGVLMPWSALIASGLFLLFGGAVAINLFRGRRDIACGCFGATEAGHLTWGIVFRDASLAILAVLCIGQLETSPHLIAQLATGESIATSLIALAVLLMGWLWHTIATLWHLPASSEVPVSDHGPTLARGD